MSFDLLFFFYSEGLFEAHLQDPRVETNGFEPLGACTICWTCSPYRGCEHRAALLGDSTGAAIRVHPSEEHAVGLTTELGEVDFRRGRRNKPETVSCALLRCCRHVNGRGRLEEVTREQIHWVAESDNAPCHATPLHVERVDDRAHNVSERMGRIETIRNGEGVEHRADVPQVKLGRASIQVSPCTTFGDGSHPEGQSWGNSGIVGMQAQRACCQEAVKSYKGECAFMRISIRGDELAPHEPHVGMEVVRGTVAGVQVCSGASQKQVGLCDDTAKVKDL